MGLVKAYSFSTKHSQRSKPSAQQKVTLARRRLFYAQTITRFESQFQYPLWERRHVRNEDAIRDASSFPQQAQGSAKVAQSDTRSERNQYAPPTTLSLISVSTTLNQRLVGSFLCHSDCLSRSSMNASRLGSGRKRDHETDEGFGVGFVLATSRSWRGIVRGDERMEKCALIHITCSNVTT